MRKLRYEPGTYFLIVEEGAEPFIATAIHPATRTTRVLWLVFVLVALAPIFVASALVAGPVQVAVLWALGVSLVLTQAWGVALSLGSIRHLRTLLDGQPEHARTPDMAAQARRKATAFKGYAVKHTIGIAVACWLLWRLGGLAA